jgi:hypothetical protein
MARYQSYENEPITKWGGIPIYLTTIITGLLVVGFIMVAFLYAARSPFLDSLTFKMPMGSWTGLFALFSYPFVNPVSFFTPLSILFFYNLSLGLETHLGRVFLSKLLLSLVGLGALFVCMEWWIFKTPSGLSGDSLILAALLVAFATLYPRADWFGWIPFKWLAFACILCGSLMLFANHAWLSLSILWASCALAFWMVLHARESEHDDYVPFAHRLKTMFRKTPKLRVLPPPSSRTHRQIDLPKQDAGDEEVDGLLDKISKSGIASLTDTERARLERAREELLKKEQR